MLIPFSIIPDFLVSKDIGIFFTISFNVLLILYHSCFSFTSFDPGLVDSPPTSTNDAPILYKPWLHGLSHITGGGIIENTHRIIEKNQDIKINWDSWERPEIFNLIQREGNIKFKDMIRPFNLGIGMVLVIDKDNVNEVESYFNKLEETFYYLGEVI